jgi:gamma-glutamylputrescine oxidase
MVNLRTIHHELNQSNYYEASTNRPTFPTLEDNIRTDVVIIGAGFSGLSAAIHLAKRGYQVAILEADDVCSGASGRNGGQTIVGYACSYDDLKKQLGIIGARTLWDMSIQAVRQIDQNISEFGIHCHRVHGYLQVADSSRKAKALEEDVKNLQKRGVPCTFSTGPNIQEHINSQRYIAAYHENISGHLHPLQYGLGLANAAQNLGVRIYTKTTAQQLKRGKTLKAITQKGEVSAHFGLLAGNSLLATYAPSIAPEIYPRIMPVGTYIIGTEKLSTQLCQQTLPSNVAVCDNNFVLDYFRLAESHLLFGGQVSYTARTPKRLEEKMRSRMLHVFPHLKNIATPFLWGGFVDISMNRAPDFGRLDKNLYYLQGFSGHGVAMTGMAGELVAEAIHGQATKFDLFTKIRHHYFIGGKLLRTPLLALGTLYYRLRDLC